MIYNTAHLDKGYGVKSSVLFELAYMTDLKFPYKYDLRQFPELYILLHGMP